MNVYKYLTSGKFKEDVEFIFKYMELPPPDFDAISDLIYKNDRYLIVVSTDKSICIEFYGNGVIHVGILDIEIDYHLRDSLIHYGLMTEEFSKQLDDIKYNNQKTPYMYPRLVTYMLKELNGKKLIPFDPIR